jgi:transcriptional regulator with XRE-family HTH domain
MEIGRNVPVNGRLNRIVEKLRDKAYRDAYVEAHVKVGIPHQIRALRDQAGRNWSQAELGRRSGKPANVISRLEDPDSGGNTIRTCLEMASAFDVALLVKFVSFGRFLKEYEDVSPQALEVPSFTSDPGLAEAPVPKTNILNAGIDVTQAGQPAYFIQVKFHLNSTLADYRPEEEKLAGKINYAGKSYEFQDSLLSQRYSDRASIGG